MRIGNLAGAITAGLSLLAAASASDAPAVLRLSTTDTSITVEGGNEAPRLMTLGGFVELANRARESLPDLLDAHGVPRPLKWRLDRAASRTDSQAIELVYVCDSPALGLVWRWRARASFGPLEHSIEIRNLSDETLWLPLQPSFRFDWAVEASAALRRMWIEKGAAVPSSAGTHLDALRSGDRWQGTSSTYARPLTGQPREMIPWLLVDEPDTARRGWYLGIEFSGRTQITLEREGSSVRGDAGLNPQPGPYRTRLPPGETFATPTIFVGTFEGGPDGAGNLQRRWLRAVLAHPQTLADTSYPLLVSNSWGSGMAVDEGLARHMIEDGAALGLEMFHLDAGWFRGVGDWRPDPARFPHGIASLAEFAHQHGMRFGLWVSWAQAGMSPQAAAISIADPAARDWLIADPPAGWKLNEPFKGITIDVGVPAAAERIEAELERIVTDYRLDMLEHDGYLIAQGSTRADHPAAPPEAGTVRVYEDSGYVWVDGSNSTDVSDHATRAYYALYERLRARHPHLLLELCNDGGRMVDFGSAAHGDYFSTTDTYDPLANRRAFYDASHVLPAAMLESYVAQWPTPRLENFRYMLRSAMLGWFSLMLDTRRWTDGQRAEARAEFALYRSVLRPLIREADLYHVSDRPDGLHWDGIEYFSAAQGRGVLYAFRGSAPGEAVRRFRLSGLAPGKRYLLRFNDRRISRVFSGRVLRDAGVAVTLPMPLSSELVFLTQLD